MSIRKVSFETGEFYHIYNRGNSKQKIFQDQKDYERFLSLLFLANGINNFNYFNLTRDRTLYDFDRGENLVAIASYCLMPNHFHILITQTDKGSISKFMQKLTTAYVMYYNEKYKRSGSLFEGKFKSEHVDNDNHLKYLFSYIHLNPVKLLESKWKELGIKNKLKVLGFLKKYKFSSFKDYLGEKREESIILNKKPFPDYFPTSKIFLSEILEWINYV
ncbi:MAG: transposase [bacterium]|nr:transposase [bacterium]